MATENDPVTIEELDIVRAPGFETEGFTVDELVSGINLVHGPNAAGKTTTAAALEKTLWPDAADTSDQLVGQLQLNGEQWRVAVQNGDASYQRDGQEAAAPTLPSVDQRDRYRLSLHDLLQQETRNESFAETIKRESAGGYDLSAAHDALEYDDSPINRRKGEYQDAKDAIDDWREKRNATQNLEEERSRLSRLQKDLEEAKDARSEKEALEQANKYLEAKTELETAEEALDKFRSVLSKVDGDEFEQVEELDAEIQEWQEEKREAQEEKQRAEATLEAVSLPDEGLPEGTIDQLKNRLDKLENQEAEQIETQEEIEEVKAQRESAREDIPFEIETADLVDIEVGTWAELSAFVRQVEQVESQRQTKESVEQWAEGGESSSIDSKSLDRGTQALEQWLIEGPADTSTTDGDAAFRLGVISAFVIGLAGAALGFLVNPILFGVVLLGAGILVYGYMQRDSEKGVESNRETHREAFEKTGVEPPNEWTVEGVRSRLIELYDEIAEQKVVDERHQRRDAIIEELDLESQREALEEKRDELIEELGAAPETENIELAVITRRIIDWQEAHDDLVGLQKKLEKVEENLEEARFELQQELAEYDYEDIEDSADAKKAIRDLESRKSKHQTATSELETARKTIERAEEKIESMETQREEIFSELDLEVGEYDELKSLCDQVHDYETWEKKVDENQLLVDREHDELKSFPGYDTAYEEATRRDLRAKLDEVKETAAEYDDIHDQISRIETKIDEAKKKSDLEESIREKERALAELETRLEEDYSSMVGDMLVDHLQEETIEATRPAVFQRANELLATITHGRYSLDLEEGGQTFRAFDTAKQKGFALDELSSGTRLQMLLAVRLAFVEHHEQGVKLPIILDETLANTDDHRAKVIIESMIELARNGRQIFYFTAQGDELLKWQTALEDAQDVDWTTVDLAETRGLDRGIELPEFDGYEAVIPDPPLPAEHDHGSYAEELEVGRLNPYEDLGTAHLWYLVADVDTLYDLLDLGIERWGQLENLLERGREEFIPADPETIERIRENAAALEEFVRAWRIGRGSPVNREVLEASGAVSDTFIDRVSELANELAGDPEALIEALNDGEVNRFQSNKIDELEAYLQDTGYIETRPPLADGDILLRMIDRLEDEGLSRDMAKKRVTDLMKRVLDS